MCEICDLFCLSKLTWEEGRDWPSSTTIPNVKDLWPFLPVGGLPATWYQKWEICDLFCLSILTWEEGRDWPSSTTIPNLRDLQLFCLSDWRDFILGETIHLSKLTKEQGRDWPSSNTIPNVRDLRLFLLVKTYLRGRKRLAIQHHNTEHERFANFFACGTGEILYSERQFTCQNLPKSKEEIGLPATRYLTWEICDLFCLSKLT
jgi:hypothetical protein